MDRWAEAKKPVCVSSCPIQALDAGPIEELRAKYGDVREAEGFVYFESLAPSITFNPKKDFKSLEVRKIEIMPNPGCGENYTKNSKKSRGG